MSNDFDFLLGSWRVVNTRLERWLCGCRDWIEFESTHEEKKLRQGEGTVAFHQYVLDSVSYERNILRSYHPRHDFWSIDRMDGRTQLIMHPLEGTFWENKGSFLSHGTLDSFDVLIHVEWTKICATFASWEQSLSRDNGKTWETNWVMDFFRQ